MGEHRVGIHAGLRGYAAARSGLAFLRKDAAVFWPASGISVGVLVTLGRRVQAALVIGVVTNLTVDSLWPSPVSRLT